MTLKQQAIVQTLAVLAAIIGASVGVTIALSYLTSQEIVMGLSIASIVFLIYSMYGVILSRLEYRETLKRLVDTAAK